MTDVLDALLLRSPFLPEPALQGQLFIMCFRGKLLLQLKKLLPCPPLFLLLLFAMAQTGVDLLENK